jgi:hypothetical protein
MKLCQPFVFLKMPIFSMARNGTAGMSTAALVFGDISANVQPLSIP